MSGQVNSNDRPVWGVGATIGFSLACGLAISVAQLIAVGAVVGARRSAESQVDISNLAESLGNDGGLLGVTSIVGTIVGLVLVIGVIKLRRGASVLEYLAIVPISRKTLGLVIAIAAGFIVAADSLTLMLGRPIVPQFMVETYQSRTWPALFWVAVVIAAPVLEEVFFRGFILAGFRQSRLGDIGSIVIISIAWALFHTQYGIYEITMIFVEGILLGAIRIRTGSLWSTIAMHAFANCVATTETVFYISKVIG